MIMNNTINKISSTINKWNRTAAHSHDLYLGEITLLVFGVEYDYSIQKNYISDFEKLSRIWKLLQRNHDSSEKVLSEIKDIINM